MDLDPPQHITLHHLSINLCLVELCAIGKSHKYRSFYIVDDKIAHASHL